MRSSSGSITIVVMTLITLFYLFLFALQMSQEECNTFACDFDNRECSYTIGIYQNCSAIRHGVRCYDLFANGRCDRACNSADCLYDGWDCASTTATTCTEFHEGYCRPHYADGRCDPGCDVPECAHDGLDCVSEPTFAPGLIVIIVRASPKQFREASSEFLRQLGQLVHSTLVVAKDSDGNQMISPWYGSGEHSRRKRGVEDEASLLSRVKRDRTTSG